MADSKILVVEDETIVALELKETLVRLGYSVVGTVDNGPEALRRVERDHPDLVLMDIHIKGPMDGIETAEEIHSSYGVPVIYLTAHSDHETISRAVQTLPFGYLVKPFNERSLYSNIEMALHKHQIRMRMQPGAASPEPKPEPPRTPAPPPSGLSSPLRPVLDAVGDPLFIVDGTMRLVCYNTAFAQFCASMGLPRLSIGAPLYEIVPPNLVGTADLYQKTLSTGRSERFERSLGTGELELLVTIRKIPSHQDRDDTRMLAVIRDLTREKTLQRQNARLNEEVAHLKDHLDGIARIGPRIKTPVREILKLASIQDLRLLQTLTLQKTTLPGIVHRAEKALELIAEIDVRLLAYQEERDGRDQGRR